MLVTGAPGTGKTTIARPLAAALGLPLLAKDTIKEALGSVVEAGSLDESRRLGVATYEVLFAIAAEMPAAVLDANFERSRARDRLIALHPSPVEVFCRCEPEVAMARYTARSRHPVHVDGLMVEELRARLKRGQEPLGLGGPVLEVDTDGDVDVEAIARWVRAALEHAR